MVKPNQLNNVVKVSIPASVAYDYKKMTKVTKIVLERLGCSPCHSGYDIRFQLEQLYAFNAKAELIKESAINF